MVIFQRFGRHVRGERIIGVGEFWQRESHGLLLWTSSFECRDISEN
jgi:hypothetical protein